MIYGTGYLKSLHGIEFFLKNIKCLFVLVLAEAD